MTMGLHDLSGVENNIGQTEIQWARSQIVGRVIYIYIELSKNSDEVVLEEMAVSH